MRAYYYFLLLELLENFRYSGMCVQLSFWVKGSGKWYYSGFCDRLMIVTLDQEGMEQNAHLPGLLAGHDSEI